MIFIPLPHSTGSPGTGFNLINEFVKRYKRCQSLIVCGSVMFNVADCERVVDPSLYGKPEMVKNEC